MSIVTLKGKIRFDPTNKTKKHELQADWKVVAMVLLEGEHCEYYSWFLQKHYKLELNKPLRGAHITFINDRIDDVKGNTIEEKKANWEALKAKWDGQMIEVSLNPDVRTDGKHWWLNLPEEGRTFLQEVRTELGLGRPYYGMHMTIGYANERNIDHSIYLHECIKRKTKAYETN